MKNSFYVLKTYQLHENIKLWYSLFPKEIVTPYYAMKCNNNKFILGILHQNGFNFDCASKKEIDVALSISKDAKKIIFANPVKSQSDIKYAVSKGINLFTLDNLEELNKLDTINYLLRIAVNDNYSKCKLNTKFGMSEKDILNFSFKGNFKGIAFHVGSNCMSAQSYKDALQRASLYSNGGIIDIGGGFNKSLSYDDLLKISSYVLSLSETNKLIAEPGRFMVEDVMDLYVKVIGKSKNKITINNSIYGDLNCIAFDHHVIDHFDIIRNGKIIQWTKENAKEHIIFGNTCDSIDVIKDNILCPEILEGDVLKFPNMGAYTLVARSSFNGIKCADIFSV